MYTYVHMSMNMDMSGGSTEYADHEVQIITGQTDFTGSGGTEQVEVLDQLEPLSNRGLDSDELAELVYMRRHSAAYIDKVTEENQTSPGELYCEHSLGINLSGPEIPPNANANNPTSEQRTTVEGSPSNVTPTNVRGANYSEPGVIDFGTVIATSGYDEAAGGAGAGASAMAKTRELNFRQAFGSGPYVDRTDDITVFAEMNSEQNVADVSLEMTYALYWNVEEMPEGRASFARP